MCSWGLEGAGGDEGAAERLKGVWLMVLSTTGWAPAERGVGESTEPHRWVPRVEKEGVEINDFNLEGVRTRVATLEHYLVRDPAQ